MHNVFFISAFPNGQLDLKTFIFLQSFPLSMTHIINTGSQRREQPPLGKAIVIAYSRSAIQGPVNNLTPCCDLPNNDKPPPYIGQAKKKMRQRAINCRGNIISTGGCKIFVSRQWAGQRKEGNV